MGRTIFFEELLKKGPEPWTRGTLNDVGMVVGYYAEHDNPMEISLGDDYPHLCLNFKEYEFYMDSVALLVSSITRRYDPNWVKITVIGTERSYFRDFGDKVPNFQFLEFDETTNSLSNILNELVYETSAINSYLQESGVYSIYQFNKDVLEKQGFDGKNDLIKRNVFVLDFPFDIVKTDHDIGLVKGLVRLGRTSGIHLILSGNIPEELKNNCIQLQAAGEHSTVTVDGTSHNIFIPEVANENLIAQMNSISSLMVRPEAYQTTPYLVDMDYSQAELCIAAGILEHHARAFYEISEILRGTLHSRYEIGQIVSIDTGHSFVDDLPEFCGEAKVTNKYATLDFNNKKVLYTYDIVLADRNQTSLTGITEDDLLQMNLHDDFDRDNEEGREMKLF